MGVARDEETIVVSSENFSELLRLVGGIINLKAEFERDNFIVTAVDDEYGASNFANIIDCGIIESREPLDGHIRIVYTANFAIRGKGTLDNEACAFDFSGKISSDTSAE